MELKLVKIEKPAEVNFILGQSHFIKTVEDLNGKRGQIYFPSENKSVPFSQP